MEQASSHPRLAALAAACRSHGFDFLERAEPALRGLDVYLELLLKWNKAMNLVGHAGREEILEDLVLDSFHLAAFLESLPLPDAPECWDFGAGAGLPGVPLRLLWQAGDYWLVEAREKRALFLQNVLAACPLPGTRVWRGRVENFMATAKAADLLISRAFMPWPQLLELVSGKLAPGGLVVCLTLEEAPATLPESLHGNWRLLCSRQYSPSALKPDKLRHFWAFEQIQRG